MKTIVTKETDNKHLFYKVFFTVLSSTLLLYFFLKKDLYISIYTDAFASADVFNVVLYSRIIFVIIVFLLTIFVIFFPDKYMEKHSKKIGGTLFILTPISCFFALEYANIMQNPILWDVMKKIGKKAGFISIFIIVLFLLLFFFITTSSKFAICATSSIIAIVGVGCYFTFSFRGIPPLASDLSIMGTALNVMGDYEYVLNYPCYVLILVMFLQITLACKLPKITWFKKKWHLILSGLYTIGTIFSIYILVFTPYLSTLNFKVNTFNPQKSYAKQGAIVTLTRSIQLLMVEKPDGYSAEVVEDIAKRYASADATPNENAKKPNIIVIMDEAFSNLQNVDDFETNIEVMPFYNSISENAIKGDMYVSVFGGQTANSEFEVLTSNSMAFIPSSSTPYQIFIKDELSNLTSFLKSNEYVGNLAIHPYKPAGYNRPNVYPLLGFEDFLDVSDFEDAELVRNFVSDKSSFNRIIEEYEKSKETGKPFYAFNVTMQNHSNYKREFENFQHDVQITDTEYLSELTDDVLFEANCYLSLIHISDRELGNLIEYFENQDDDTIIVFFGDHRPGITERFYTKLFGQKTSTLSSKDLMEKYKVPYLIWANYDIEEKTNQTTSTNYLTSKTLDLIGFDLPGYNRFLLDLSEKVPVITGNGYFGADGNFYEVNDESSPYYDAITEYRYLEYNNMFDKKNHLENFFE